MQMVKRPDSQTDWNELRLFALGPGNHANATIGRALRLFIINLRRGDTGINLMGTLECRVLHLLLWGK